MSNGRGPVVGQQSRDLGSRGVLVQRRRSNSARAPPPVAGSPGRRCPRRRDGTPARRFGVPVQQRIGRPAQSMRHPRSPLEFETHLHQVGVERVVGEFGVEQHAGLQRRQRPHVGQRRAAVLEVLDRVLPSPDEIEIGRGEPAATRPRMRGERSERLHPQLREFLDLVAGEDARRVRPRGAQLGAVARSTVIALTSTTAATGSRRLLAQSGFLDRRPAPRRSPWRLGPSLPR